MASCLFIWSITTEALRVMQAAARMSAFYPMLGHSSALAVKPQTQR